MQSVKIGPYEIGMGTKPFIVAEMSGNHNQSLERALQIVEAAARAGAHAVKLQTYTADTMTLNVDREEFKISDPSSLWFGKHLHQLYQEAHTPWEWHKPIMDRCKQKGLMCFSSPFDETAVDFLESLDVPCFKIASFENTDLPLIRKVAKTGKPVIISTGLASLAELAETVTTCREAGIKSMILLKCTSAYPARAEDINLATIPHMAKMFDCPVGLSDHTLGIAVPLTAVAMGASFIEKHFTLSRAEKGVDAAFSLEPEELQDLVREAERAWLAIGKIHYHRTASEKQSASFRRSIYVSKNIQAGDTLTGENIKCVRPAFGLAPKYWDEVIGRRVKVALEPGTPLEWTFLD